MIVVAAHQEEIGRRQHRHAMPLSASCARKRRHLVRRQQRELRHVPDHDPAAAPVLLGELAHEMDVHGVGRVADIEMHVDVDVELARQLEDAPDLRRLHRCRSAARRR